MINSFLFLSPHRWGDFTLVNHPPLPSSEFPYPITSWSDVGAIATAIVVILTLISTRAAIKSSRLASKALEHARENNRKDEFSRHFTLLLEQHELQQVIVKKLLG